VTPGYSGPDPGETFTIKQNFSVKIWPEPTWITTQDDIPEGMDWRRKYAHEFLMHAPPTDKITAIFEAEYPEGMKIEWVWTCNDPLPSGASTTYGAGDSLETEPGQEVTFTQTLPGMAQITGNPQTDVSRDYPFTIFMTAKDDNKNIDGKEVPGEFYIRMWKRRYLHIDINLTQGFVVRRDELDVDWNAWDSDTAANPVNAPYRNRRAVMPGTEGELIARRSPFVVWEVKGTNDPSIIGVDNANSQLIRSGGIGSISTVPGAPGWWTTANHSHVAIKMPDFSNGARVDDDIYIRGVWMNDPRSQMTASLPQGTVGVPWTERNEGNVSIPARGECSHQLANNPVTGTPPSPRIDCTCPSLNVLWRESTPAVLPGFGLRIEDIDIRTARIVGEPSIPTDPANPTNVTFNLTLRGTMVVERSWPLVIRPKPGPWYGNVDGNDVRDLRDLILLMLIVRTPVEERDKFTYVFENADIDGNGSVDLVDLELLSRFFARPRATLPLE